MELLVDVRIVGTPEEILQYRLLVKAEREAAATVVREKRKVKTAPLYRVKRGERRLSVLFAQYNLVIPRGQTTAQFSSFREEAMRRGLLIKQDQYKPYFYKLKNENELFELMVKYYGKTIKN